MDKIKGIAKDGWHPTGSDGKSKESWRRDFKGVNQVAGWVGKSKDPHPAAQEHQSRPIASLKDPEAFPPPPKNVHYYEDAASPQATTPDRRGLGAPSSAGKIRVQREREESEKRLEKIAQKPVPPSIPYRANTTGLSTSNLPKPPVRRAAVGDLLTPQASDNTQAKSVLTKPKPPLPPRLPPRESSTPQDPPPSYNSAIEDTTAHARLNQSALNRLGSAGISVPGLSIGGSSEASNTYQDQAGNGTATPAKTQKPALGELHSQLSGVSNKMPGSEPPSNEGTTFAQKQAALKAANSFRSDPSSVSLSDAKATAVTAHNFRERHGDQVISGLTTAQSINRKYNIAEKVGGHTGNLGASQETLDPPALDRVPKDKKSPPPVPLSSKPRF